jgi:hypothetical protein
MSQPPREDTRRRDFILLPLIALLATAILGVSAELIARTRFYELPVGMAACLDGGDPAKGVRGRPNTVCHEKSLESDNIEYRLDSRGYRSDTDLPRKQSDVYRIVLIGSSVAMGERTPLNTTPAALLAPRLSNLTDRKVEVYNEGMAWGFARNASLRFRDAIEVQPDLILWVVTPLDIARSEETLAREVETPLPASGIQHLKTSILQYIRSHGGDIVIGQVLRHYLYELQSEDQFVHAALQSASPDDESGFLRIEQGPVWQKHWADFAGHAHDMFAQARAGGISLAVAFVPNRLQAAVISRGEWPAGFDPYSIDRNLQKLVQADGGTFIELLPHYAAVPGSEHFYLPIDGHPTSDGYAFLSEALARQLTGGPIPALAAARPGATHGP